MCGIIGILQADPADPELSDEAIRRLAHRGPDGLGGYRAAHVALGHTRLSIIDLSPSGAQPMSYADRRLWISFNGEIYNHCELRSELVDMGLTFRGTSDTEVILAAYFAWGKSCVQRLRGMFAFAIWDGQERELFLARDRCGERPLLYCHEGGRFLFASEMQALLPLRRTRPSLDARVAAMYLHHQFVPEPHTLVNGVHKLPSGCHLTVRAAPWTDVVSPQRYWDQSRISALTEVGAESVIARVRDGLVDAVRSSLRSDVPVGIALSGGLDSSAIGWIAQHLNSERMHAFSVGYPGRPPWDEREEARGLAQRLGMIFHEVEISTDDFLRDFPDMVRSLDEPIADPAAYGHYAIPRAARAAGITVLLSGIGGDELFWGYNWVRQAAAANAFWRRHHFLARVVASMSCNAFRWAACRGHSIRLPGMLQDLASLGLHALAGRTCASEILLYDGQPEYQAAAFHLDSVCGPALRGLTGGAIRMDVADDSWSDPRGAAAVVCMLCESWLSSNCLTLGDRVSMRFGVEMRVPLLDHRLVELAAGLRLGVPDHGLGPKARLRAALAGTLPTDVLARRKKGFRPPVREWLSRAVAVHGGCLRQGLLQQAGIVSKEGVASSLARPERQSDSELLMSYKLVLLENWWRSVAA